MLPEAFDPADCAAEVEEADKELPGTMSFLDHLEDLRWTLFKSICAFALAVIIVALFISQFSDLLRWPYDFAVRGRDLQMSGLINTSILGVFSVIFYLFLGGGLCLSLPFMLYFLGQFIAPGLEEKELRLLRPACMGAFALFISGALFSFFVLTPAALRASILFNDMLGFTPLWTASSYYAFVTWTTIGVGAAFQFPLVLLILVHLGLLSHAKLVAFRKYSVVVFLCICAVITPTTDPFTFLLLAIPLSILYELSIVGARRIERKR